MKAKALIGKFKQYFPDEVSCHRYIEVVRAFVSHPHLPCQGLTNAASLFGSIESNREFCAGRCPIRQHTAFEDIPYAIRPLFKLCWNAVALGVEGIAEHDVYDALLDSEDDDVGPCTFPTPPLASTTTAQWLLLIHALMARVERIPLREEVIVTVADDFFAKRPAAQQYLWGVQGAHYSLLIAAEVKGSYSGRVRLVLLPSSDSQSVGAVLDRLVMDGAAVYCAMPEKPLNDLNSGKKFYKSFSELAANDKRDYSARLQKISKAFNDFIRKSQPSSFRRLFAEFAVDEFTFRQNLAARQTCNSRFELLLRHAVAVGSPYLTRAIGALLPLMQEELSLARQRAQTFREGSQIPSLKRNGIFVVLTEGLVSAHAPYATLVAAEACDAVDVSDQRTAGQDGDRYQYCRSRPQRAKRPKGRPKGRPKTITAIDLVEGVLIKRSPKSGRGTRKDRDVDSVEQYLQSCSEGEVS